ncbi:MAG: CPBP family intramembrane metalloprotease [Pirellulales bacterium]|nr:CPBP family intramembrane metalloprotease [Pirellulales bacterium]
MDTDGVPVELVEEPLPEKSGYWGLWSTIGFSMLVVLVDLGANVLAVVGFIVVNKILDSDYDPMSTAVPLEHNGLMLAIGMILSTPVAVGLIVLLIHVRRGIPVRQYLALRPVSIGKLLFWLAATGLFIVGEEVLSDATGNDTVPKFMIEAWQTAGWLPLLWLAVIVLAPLVEETFFRGFLFVGLRNSALGGAGAVLVTSGIWAVSHTQYDLFHMSIIFAVGLLFGIARIRSRSLYVPLAMHGLMNLVATVQVAWVITEL